MFEIVLAGAVVAVLVAVAMALYWIAWSWLLGFGMALTALGLLVGVPTGVLYHLRLRSALVAQDELPARWWLHTVPFHDRLEPDRRRLVMRPFYAGAAGFSAILLGCGLALVGFLRSPWGP
ncbi:hypothetical protein [Haliangium sp.]|uniref:hypothetical protein n=1 Tax=Haliangium sp. TaxID=2663208 RepID=UPI003D0E03BB